ncbi:MAG: DUF115 domain-containing protein [Planctomycetes bacterium]|nr:DUF115 domain-containing protein [Planctomycetota bacterium]
MSTALKLSQTTWTTEGADGAAVGDPQLFLDNMAALWRSDPRMAQRIDEVDDGDRLPLLATKSGHFTASMKTPDGRTLLHSRYDPIAEAKKLIDTVETDENFCFLVNGFGLGYHVCELLSRLKGEAFLVVSEPSLAVLSTALCCVDLADAFRSNRLVILNQLDKALVHERLKPYKTLMMLGARFVTHPPSQQASPDFHDQSRQLITEFVAYSRMMLLTLVGNAEITCRNIAHNLPTYLSTPPIDVLRDRFKGYPGIVVAAGPSLHRNIDQLADAKGRAVLCAVQTTFKPLLSHGIVPDFVTSLDFHAMSRQFFHGVPDAADVHLVAEPKVTWHVLDDYAGPVSLLHSDFVDLLIGAETAPRQGLRPGATVAHLAFYLLQYMGCDPIVFVGQDLAFTGHCFYTPGVEVHQTWRSEINRFNSMETREWERIVRNRTILRKVRDVHGREIYSDDLLMTYREQFEKDFLGASARIIDATEGGALMRGAQIMTFREVLEQFCGRPIPAERFAYRDECSSRSPSRLAAAREQLEKRLEEIEHFDQLCEEMIVLLHELESLTGDPNGFNRRLVRVDELRLAVRRLERAYKIVNAATQLVELQRYTADRKLELTEAEGPERAKRQLTRDVRFVEGMHEGARRTISILRDTLARFDTYMNKDRS